MAAKFHKGQTVLLKVTIDQVDEGDPRLTYLSRRGVEGSGPGGMWFGEPEILAVLPDGPEAEVAPEAKGDWIEAGTRVRHAGYPALGVGVLDCNDFSATPYRVVWPSGEVHWGKKESVQVATENAPEPRLALGTLVRHLGMPEHGIGQVVADDHDDVPYLVRWPDGFDYYCKRENLEVLEARSPRFHEGEKVIHKNHPEFGLGVIEVVGPPLDKGLVEYWTYGKEPSEGVTLRSYSVRYPGMTWVTAEEHLIRADGSLE